MSTAPETLRSYWHPVAKASDVGEQPLAVRLLDERVVLYRTSDEVVAFEDLCIHRGVRLSLGSVKEGNLTCAYHGWTYGPTGECIHVPSLPAGRRIPSKARTKKYRTDERYGLVWVCLDEPRLPIPVFPQPDFPEYGANSTASFIVQFDWSVNAARMTENSMDHSHFPFVHAGVLGDPARPLYPDVEVDLRDDGMSYAIHNHANNTIRYYHLTLPFTLEIAVVSIDDASKRAAQLFPVCPVSSRESRHWFISVRDHDLDVPTEQLIERDNSIFFQDQTIVEHQHPEELPIDITEELHLKGTDKAALEYRKMLGGIGVEW